MFKQGFAESSLFFFNNKNKNIKNNQELRAYEKHHHLFFQSGHNMKF